MEKALELPFSVTSYGGIGFTSDRHKIWQDRVLSAVLTGINERVMRPTYGSQVISKPPFEIMTAVGGIIEKEVNSVFSVALPFLVLKSVFSTEDLENGTISTQINYILPSGEEAVSVIKTGIINRTGEITQEF